MQGSGVNSVSTLQLWIQNCKKVCAENYVRICDHGGDSNLVSVFHVSKARWILTTVSAIWSSPVGIYLLKVNNKNTRTRCEIFSKLTIKTPERRRTVVLIVNFEHISHLALMSLLLTLNMQLPAGRANKF